MAMGKCFRLFEKVNPPNPYSILLEQRNKEETLLFESQAVAILCMYFYLSIYLEICMVLIKYFFYNFDKFEIKLIYKRLDCFSAAHETESVKRQYTKLLDAYGCLGVLQLNAG